MLCTVKYMLLFYIGFNVGVRLIIVLKCDVGHFRKAILISCFLKKRQCHQYKFQASFPNISGKSVL